MPDRPSARSVLWRAAARFALFIMLFVALLQSGTVALAWWRDELPQLGVYEVLWLLFLPIGVALYLRFFSVFRTDCEACVPDDSRNDGPRGP